MSLNYHKVNKHPRNFRDITGLKIEEFEKIVKKVRPEWEKLEKQKKRHGRTAKLPTLEDKMLCVILYYRTYITHRFLGCLFNLHNANICRLLKKIEPLLAKKITIKKDRTLTPERILKVLADVTEQQIQQPKESKKRKRSYSGKKKMTTMKTEIVIEESGQILSVSRSYRGKIHDFRIRKQEKLLPTDSIKHADSGYQGWQKLQSNVVIPYKKYRKKLLTEEQKEHNRELASFRMRVENKIRELKIFKILSYVYRNFQKKYNMRFNIIAGLVNLRHGF
ncbi:transposase family protein [Candidatus Wolbachia massiliensis]|uniref:Transposase n=4 Tax=Candidatus Wolbachia massiliensis TaxID=1845000 RepID=A0A7L7YLG3_9RICK|nr:transposase family protein [Candidatus Wolbachia massiliensis]QOD37833.1 transposase [Candidatus Wolbachia massiliensis]QOD37842.1 transposase [Candidatus Wolbachia massiliensis]QOD37852.1 transposase [Candidatus Wolbachia massiliensis]QOD37979.1 transposase [Candidatus Wolbachia massiliensis]QOD37983.1 transposase [Candidatus Wolbachia massiliensis]